MYRFEMRMFLYINIHIKLFNSLSYQLCLCVLLFLGNVTLRGLLGTVEFFIFVII